MKNILITYWNSVTWNLGASGSCFWLTHDDEFIIKTVSKTEAKFLQKLLPGYYLNLDQNPHTLLPKFYGFYCIQIGGRNIRVIGKETYILNFLESYPEF